MRLPEGTISRVSLNSSGVQPDVGDSILPSISADGRWIAFASTAPLGDRSRGFGAASDQSRSNREKLVRQVYLRDAIAGRTTRVTRALNRATPRQQLLPAISARPACVVFVSEASNLAGDDNSTSDVFLYDRETGALSWSAGPPTDSPPAARARRRSSRVTAVSSPSSPDAANLVTRRPGCVVLAGDFDDINLVWDVFVLDRELGRIVRASEDELGGWMEVSAAPALGSSGQLLAFSSRHPVDATDLAGDFDLFVRS